MCRNFKPLGLKKKFRNSQFGCGFLPRTTPIDSRMMKGLLLPSGDLHLSDRLPRMGVRKNPTSGERHQMRVMCDCDTPIFKRVGETKAVSAA